MKFIAYPDRDLLDFGLADVLASALAAALRHQERVSFSVPGGTTPGPVFDILSGVALDWGRVTVFASDERWVPENHPRSNGAMLRARLLQGWAAAARYVPLYADVPRPEDAVAALSAAVAPHLPISVLLLGMGADLHTASLFPGAEGLAAALAPDAPEVVVLRAPGVPEPRVSLSRRVLSGAMATHIVITGAEKRAALDRAPDLPDAAAPVRAVLGNATVHWAP